MSEPTTQTCSACGAEITNDAAEGLCVACLLQQAALESEAGPTKGETSPTLEAVAAAFPQLEILEKIGRGGMGTVFKARQPKLDRFVALKILSADLAEKPTFADRFAREGKLLARLNHPNIVAVYDFGHVENADGGFYFLLMEYVDGVNLRQAMREERFTPEQAIAIVPKICDALQYAHDEGVLHRDIKPENILLDTKGRVKIADFGIGKFLPKTMASWATAQPEADRPSGTDTQTGQILGTPSYMAPEQLDDPNRVDHRADIYSLGVVFYELLTGELPQGRFPLPSEKTQVGAEIDGIVLKALNKERDKRQQSAGELKTEIETVSSPHNATADELSVPIRNFQSFIKNEIHRYVLPFAAKYKFLILSFVTCMCILGLVTERNIWDQIAITIILGGCVFYWVAYLFFGKSEQPSRHSQPQPETGEESDQHQPPPKTWILWNKIIAEIKTWPRWATILVLMAVLCFGVPAFLFIAYCIVAAFIFIFGDLFEAITGYYDFM